MITETEKIEFQAFALHHFHIGDVADTDFREIRLSRYGAKAGELRTIETHPIIITGMLSDISMAAVMAGDLVMAGIGILVAAIVMAAEKKG
jgi:hypothetical protein